MENQRITVQRSTQIDYKSPASRESMRHTYSVFLLMLSFVCQGCLLSANSPPDSPKDSLISTNVEARLSEDGQGGLIGIIVTTENGTVTLTGTVPKAERKARAAELARQVKGVKRVKNDLEIRADLSP